MQARDYGDALSSLPTPEMEAYNAAIKDYHREKTIAEIAREIFVRHPGEGATAAFEAAGKFFNMAEDRHDRKAKAMADALAVVSAQYKPGKLEVL